MARTPRLACAAFALALALAPARAEAAGLDDPAAQWLPRSDGAEWAYTWSNSAFSVAPRTEQLRLQARSGTTFRLRWQETGAGPYDVPSSGTIGRRRAGA